MSIRLDDDVIEMIDVLKDAQNSSSKSAAVRDALLKAYPNLIDIVKQVKAKEIEREAILAKLVKSDES